jgi:hypothetical protein
MRTLLLTAVLLGSFAALGQGRVDLQFSNQGGDSISVGAGDCGLTRTVSWTASANICNSLRIWATSAPAVARAGRRGRLDLDEIPASTATASARDSVSFDVGELPFPSSDAGGGCGARASSRRSQLRAIVAPETHGFCPSSTYTKLGPSTLIYDALAPGKPTVAVRGGLDNGPAGQGVGALGRHPAAGGGLAGGHRGRVGVTQSVDNTSFRLSPCEWGGVRGACVRAGRGGNRSEASDFQSGTPVNTRGFYEEYLESTARSQELWRRGGGLVGSAVLAVMGLWLFSRRGRS